MNTTMRVIATVTTIAVAFGLFLQSTSAQSGRGLLVASNKAATTPSNNNNNCTVIRGQGVQTFDPATGVVSGPVSNAGILNGNLEDAIDFGAGFVFTANPTVVSYTTNLTITTNHGQLKASPVTTQSILTGNGAEWGEIDPSTSTGRFAGATGIISIVFKPVGDPSVGPYSAEVTADICFDHER